jgi:hypothetical protein
MQQIPCPPLPWHTPGLRATLMAVPVPPAVSMRPARVRQPGGQAPLPDAVAVWQAPVPETAPPYDDELDWRESPEQASGDQRGSLAGPATGADGAQQDQSRPGSDDAAGPAAGSQAAGWPGQFAQVLAETLAGTRPASQLTPWTTEEARRQIRRLGPVLATGQRPQVRRVLGSAPAAGVLELTAVVGFGPRVRLLAFRLELAQPRSYRRAGPRWCCTAIESA